MTKRQLKRLAQVGETWVQTLARVHHEAYMVEAFGFDASGLSAKYFLRLVELGVVSAPAEDAAPAPNAFETVFAASEQYAGQDNRTRAEMRSWSADLWRKYLKKHTAAKMTPSEANKTITGSSGQRVTDKMPVQTVAMLPAGAVVSEHMHEAEDIARQMQDVVSPPPPGSVAPLRHLPKTFGRAQKFAYTQAIERAGLFCKRLGEVTGGDFSVPTTERWHFDRILEEVDPVLRGKRLKAIRKTVLQALQDDWKPYRLAHELQQATGDFARDWLRVAVTELQNAWNEGVGLQAVQMYGLHARIARVPETTACPDCRRIFLGADGEPIVFDMHVLLRNGNNMNVPKPQWRATLTSLHPRCRCGCVVCPPGHKVTREGNIVPT